MTLTKVQAYHAFAQQVCAGRSFSKIAAPVTLALPAQFHLKMSVPGKRLKNLRAPLLGGMERQVAPLICFLSTN
jgi:hypothetical protein